MGWRDKKVECFGSVLFRGTIPPRAEEFEFLRQQGIRIEPGPAMGGVHWALDMHHPEWGSAGLLCLREVPAPDGILIEHDVGLSPAERETARLGEMTVSVRIAGDRGNVLRDRKRLLRFLFAVMGSDGVVAVDHVSQRFWSREALADELAHDADLDIEALYTLHAVAPDDGDHATWLHSHGLEQMGFFDFDILNPHEDLSGRGRDHLRALAFAIVEGHVSRNTARFALASPGGDVRLVDVADFERRADGETRELRFEADEYHASNRAIVCEPVSGLMGRWFGSVRPSRLLSDELPDEQVVNFSHEASELMGERARLTYSRFRELMAEFAEFEFPCVVKLAYVIDGGGERDLEHLWFEVHATEEERLEATLDNEPFSIARMHPGDRGWHDISHLSDWMIFTPAGPITPRSTTPARILRAHGDELRQAMREAKEEGPAAEEEAAAGRHHTIG